MLVKISRNQVLVLFSYVMISFPPSVICVFLKHEEARQYSTVSSMMLRSRDREGLILPWVTGINDKQKVIFELSLKEQSAFQIVNKENSSSRQKSPENIL